MMRFTMVILVRRICREITFSSNCQRVLSTLRYTSTSIGKNMSSFDIPRQITDSVLMRFPTTFRMNEETSVNNYFQQQPDKMNANSILEAAQREFNNFVQTLREKDINVIVLNDNDNNNNSNHNSNNLDIPDAVFPNNWISFHENGQICLYPMYAANRRQERLSSEFLTNFMVQNGFHVDNIHDLSCYEQNNLFLEGTGVLILDRVHRLAYCSLSPRASQEVLTKFCSDFQYQAISFTAYQTHQTQRLPIYHTNVMMALGDEFVVICMSSIDNANERDQLIHSFQSTGKEIIDITEEQVNQFAGNMLQLCSTIDNKKKYLIMSSTAFHSLTSDQISCIEKYCEIIHVPLSIIELCGGGSARCMLAEIFLPRIHSLFEE